MDCTAIKMETMVPSFLVIGAMKAGTTTMWEYLRSHPSVFMSEMKETDYFVAEKNWDCGWDWYLSLFQGGISKGATIAGEASTSYSKLPEFGGVAKRIADWLPDVKLIYMVRDPIERIRSMYVHMVHGGYETKIFDQAVTALDNNLYVEISRYYRQLQEYLRYFPKERILVVSSEDMWKDPKSTMREVTNFLEVKDSGIDIGTRVHSNKSSAMRRPNTLGRLMESNAKLRSAFQRVPGKMDHLVAQATSDAIRKPLVSEAVRLQLHIALKNDTARLRQWCNKEFSHWSM